MNSVVLLQFSCFQSELLEPLLSHDITPLIKKSESCGYNDPDMSIRSRICRIFLPAQTLVWYHVTKSFIIYTFLPNFKPCYICNHCFFVLLSQNCSFLIVSRSLPLDFLEFLLLPLYCYVYRRSCSLLCSFFFFFVLCSKFASELYNIFNFYYLVVVVTTSPLFVE